jgi:tRNA modification GTPase
VLTSYALATAHGKAGVAIIRVSGQNAHESVRRLSRQDIVVGRPTLRNIYNYVGEFLDQALVIAFKSPNSFTGEDVAEFHLHGSIAVIQATLAALSRMEDFRMAEAGEFTRRALENGKLDIAKVEGLADLLESETEAQRKQALRVLSGDLGKLSEKWRSKLIRASALLEATIDFADEDVPIDVTPEVTDLIKSVILDLGREIAGVTTAERIRTGFEIAIVGAPNVGKSTLLNALSGRKAAITSEIAGTTRDVIEVRMDLNGLPVTLLDTAGVRDTTDLVEGLGIELALQRANDADVVVVLSESSEIPEGLSSNQDILIYRAKCDSEDLPDGISGLTGYGIDKLISEVTEKLKVKTSNVGIATRERHRIALESARTYLDASINLLSLGPDYYDICVAEIQAARNALDGLIGRIDVESVLDEIFSSFCLGK